MERARLKDLQQWITSENRKPLVIRGARQVGKTWLVRHFAKTIGRKLIEINFEKTPNLQSLFESNDPPLILRAISAALSVDIESNTHLLFLDEIQICPEILAKLRWFYEDMPELPLIAAGSLLEFVLADHTFSMPVGRINYLYLEPLSFEEFLLAKDKKQLLSFIKQFEWSQIIPKAIHDQLIALIHEYTIIGGLPAAVSSWTSLESLPEISQIHEELLSTYRDDFSKYARRLDTQRLEETLLAVPRQLSQKFVYSQVNPNVGYTSVKQALDLLSKAKLCHSILSTSANGVPLGAEINDKFFKMIFLDVGLVSNLLGLQLHQLNSTPDISLINRGAVAEQIVGQLLRTLFPSFQEPKLYYWQRTEKGALAEVDYIIQQGHQLIPVEVKAGTSGTLKSLHILMDLKNLPTAIRINSDEPSITTVHHKMPNGSHVEYQLFSIPPYLIGQLPRLFA